MMQDIIEFFNHTTDTDTEEVLLLQSRDSSVDSPFSRIKP